MALPVTVAGSPGFTFWPAATAMGPAEPMPPSVPLTTRTGLLDWAPSMRSVPPLTMVAPLRELLPDRTSAAVPALLNEPEPLMLPASVTATLFVTVTAPSRSIGPAKLNGFAPAKVTVAVLPAIDVTLRSISVTAKPSRRSRQESQAPQARPRVSAW